MILAIEELKTALYKSDYEATIVAMERLDGLLKTSPEAIGEFLKPATQTELHKLLEDKFSVSQRNMRVRRKVPVAKTRASLYLMAMRVALQKTYTKSNQ